MKASVIALLRQALPERAKKTLFHLSFHLAHAEFEKFAHAYASAPNMKLGLAEMAELGFSPRTIIDVGAFEGAWSRFARNLWPDSRLIMVEPNLSLKPKLAEAARDLSAELHHAVGRDLPLGGR